MAKDTQISAYISSETKQRMDMFVRETGITKARFVEDAITARLDALEALPPSAIIPTVIVLPVEEYDKLVRKIESDEPPTEALKQLMREHREASK